MLAALPHFNELLQTNYSDNDAGVMYSDVYDCLSCMAAQRAGGEAMLKQRTVHALITVWINKYTGHERALKLLTYLLHVWGAATWRENKQALHLLLPAVTKQFSQQKDQDKFETCWFLYRIIMSTDERLMEEVSGEWTWDVHKTLAEILQSKLGGPQREPALCLSSAMLDHACVPWALGPQGNGCQTLLIMVHLTCIEVRMILEDGRFEEVCRRGEVLSCCYVLLERVISYLSCGPSLSLNERQVSQLHSALVGAFNAVMFFLGEVEQQHSEQMVHSVVVASVRVLGAWIAEETTALKTEVLSRLPFLIKICQELFDQQSVVEVSDSLQESHLSIPLSKDTDHPSPDSSQSDSNITNGTHSEHRGSRDMSERAELRECSAVAGCDVFNFLLPGLCHLTAEDAARGVLLAEGAHTLLLDYTHRTWRHFQAGGAAKQQAEVTLTTLCGIFLNITVLEKELVSTHSAFKDLLSFVLRETPELNRSGCHVVLGFNLSVLGLMLLQNNKIIKGVECECFLTSCMDVFRRAHVWEGESEGAVMHVADLYVPHWDAIEELWFLGMQVMSSLMERFSSINEHIAKSGWKAQLLRAAALQKGEICATEDPVIICYRELLKKLSLS